MAPSSTHFIRLQQIRVNYLKRKELKTDSFGKTPVSALGTGALPLKASLVSITWKLSLLNLEETVAAFPTTFAFKGLQRATRKTLRVYCLERSSPVIAHLLLRQMFSRNGEMLQAQRESWISYVTDVSGITPTSEFLTY